jgi:diguanylate cyclase (GGDEF)-like protein
MIMSAPAQLVVIGSTALCESVRTALPAHNIVPLSVPLEAIWQAPEHSGADILLSISNHPNARAALAGLRRVAPKARILLTCRPSDEPLARQALADGADGYLLEPVLLTELQCALTPGEPSQPPPADCIPLVETSAPMTESQSGSGNLIDLDQFAEVLQHLDDGPRAVLERLAPLVQSALHADAIALEFGESTARTAAVGASAMVYPLTDQGQVVGKLILMPGAITPPVLTEQLATVAKLIVTTLQAAQMRQHLSKLAWRDDLSGLYNRRYFEQALDRLIETAANQRSQLTLLFFDIDDFKTYNDQYGHDTGDALIRELAELLRHSSRADDIVARYGGDEFVVVFWDAEAPRVAGSKHPTEVLSLAERFQHTIATHSFACLGQDAPGPVTISGGLSCYPWHGTTREAIVRAADQALLAAKRSGKNRMLLAGNAFPDPA